MAGAYPDIPGPRMAYDRDGTQIYQWENGTLTPAALPATGLNDETLGAWNVGLANKWIAFIFPEPRDLVGYLLGARHNSTLSAPSWQSSKDTTNGIDGTWTSYGAATIDANMAMDYRTAIQPASVTAAKAIKFNIIWGGVGTNGGANLDGFHLYGQPSATGDRLEFWHPTLNQSLNATPAWFDWGNRPRSTSATKQFRIKNLSTILTASGITVGVEALTDASPTFVSQHTFSLDGGSTFSPTVTISSLSPGQFSPVITVKQDLSASAALSLWAQRFYANAGSWG